MQFSPDLEGPTVGVRAPSAWPVWCGVSLWCGHQSAGNCTKTFQTHFMCAGGGYYGPEVKSHQQPRGARFSLPLAEPASPSPTRALLRGSSSMSGFQNKQNPRPKSIPYESVFGLHSGEQSKADSWVRLGQTDTPASSPPTLIWPCNFPAGERNGRETAGNITTALNGEGGGREINFLVYRECQCLPEVAGCLKLTGDFVLTFSQPIPM